MKNKICAVLLVLGGLVAGAAPVSADTINFEAVIVLEHRTAPDILGAIGPDTLGLDGATLVFRASFDTTDTYYDGIFGIPTVDSISESLTITGASIASTNGVRSAVAGVGFWPDGGGQYYSLPPGDGVQWSIGGTTLTLWSLTTAVAGMLIGDNVELSHFSTTRRIRPAAYDYGLFSVGLPGDPRGAARYDPSSFSASVEQVPEPGTLTLLGLGAVAAVWCRRRRASRT